MATRRDRALSYYESLDEGDYEALSSLLAEGFVHDRPDLTLEGRERFVRFMREERPRTDTTHEVDGVYVGGPPDGEDDPEVVVRGRLLADGQLLVDFADAFTFEGDRIARIVTYTQ
ncbi:nuclear transport factor 2 family protein [Halobacteriales archaeon QS_1_68_20]|nr:MAG: nuclear transport factor 2 family protein [Halobacteriales archaeon QS_1_68_20]